MARSTQEVPAIAVPGELPDVTADCSPTANLALVLVRYPSPLIVTAIPLEPAARVVRVDPSLGAPHRQRDTRFDAEKVKVAVGGSRGKLRLSKPGLGKFVTTIAQVNTAEDSEREHFLGGEVWRKLPVKIPSDRGDQLVPVTALHVIVDDHASWLARAAHLRRSNRVKGRGTRVGRLAVWLRQPAPERLKVRYASLRPRPCRD